MIDNGRLHAHVAQVAVAQEAADVEAGAWFQEGDDIVPGFVFGDGVQAVAGCVVGRYLNTCNFMVT